MTIINQVTSDPSWTDVVQAFGAVIAAVLAGGALIYTAVAVHREARKSREERERREAEREDGLRGQARLVLTDLLIEQLDEGSVLVDDSGRSGTILITVEISNNSDKSVTILDVRADYPNGASIRLLRQRRVKLQPGKQQVIRMATNDDKLFDLAEASVVLLDGAGLCWRRVESNEPERILSYPKYLGEQYGRRIPQHGQPARPTRDEPTTA